MYRLLLIDDRLEDREMYKALLAEGEPSFLRDVDLMTVDRPPDLDFYQLIHGVILDQNMTHTTGVEEARRIRARYPNLPLILMTGTLPPIDIEDGLFVAVVEKDDLRAVWDAAREMMRKITGAT